MSIGRISEFSARLVSHDFPLRTRRLRIIPVTEPLARAEINDSKKFSDLLAADVPQSWPPEHVGPPAPDGASDWENCYLTHTEGNNRDILVGLAGVKTWSPEHKTVQVGAALVPEYQGQRLGEEIVAALAEWGLSIPGINRIICDIPTDHVASAKSLERARFSRTSEAPGVGFSRFELTTSS
jgi:RimJ/RimL family protein N-acetyltransferase